jgi:hypothetical protein
MADIVRMLQSHNLNACPAPSRLLDLKESKAFVEWLKMKGVRMVKCEMTDFIYHPAERIYKAYGKIDDAVRELIEQCGEESLGMRAESTSLQNRLMVHVPDNVKKTRCSCWMRSEQ